ncbi:6475_t:CDS:2, partial [Acaulospora colombiana]
MVSHTDPTAGFEKGFSKNKKRERERNFIPKRSTKGRRIDQFACQWLFSLLDLAGVGRSIYKCQGVKREKGDADDSLDRQCEVYLQEARTPKAHLEDESSTFDDGGSVLYDSLALSVLLEYPKCSNL